MLKKIFSSLLVGLTTFLLVHLTATRTTLLDTMENSLMDGFYFMREPDILEINPYVFDRTKLLGYDEDSLAVIGKWPWKRYVHANFLNTIERFSPETVFFDIIFANPESVPEYISNKITLSADVQQQMEDAFAEMDNEFARALTRYDNVYLDLQLIEQPRLGLPEEYLQRIRLNEEISKNYAQPETGVKSPIIFNSLEPILDAFAKNAHPAVINVYPDQDGVVRFFPLYYTYRGSDGSSRNVFTVVLSMLQRLYHLDKKDIAIEAGRVVLHSAKAPVLDPITRRPRRLTVKTETLFRQVVNPTPPPAYHYNKNLYHYMVNQLLLEAPDTDRVPYFPLYVFRRDDGKAEIIDGWEVFDAARDVQTAKLDVINLWEKDIEIKTPLGSFFYINFAGREKQYHLDPVTGKEQAHKVIPTGSYKDIHLLGDLPDIPALGSDGSLKADYDILPLAAWFYNYCEERFNEVYRQAATELGEGAADDNLLRQYMNSNPGMGKYFYYYFFFQSVGVEPENLAESLEIYPLFAEQAGQEAEYYLSEKQMVAALTDFYGEQFDKYYNKFIFTGANALGLGDVHQTPYDSMTGPNIIINAFNTIATDNQLQMSVDRPYLDLMILLAIAVLFSLLYGLTNVRLSGYCFLTLFLGTFAVSYIMFSNNFFLQTTPLLIANAIIFITLVIFKLLTEERSKKFLKATFSHYLAPELIDEMHRNHTMPKLGGELKNITAYFTDIQGFSTFSEKLTPKQLVELLNEYLSAMTDILMAYRGTLDKYEGDAIIAFLGAPMELPDHALKACQVAIAMQDELDRLRKKWHREKQTPDEPARNTKKLAEEEWNAGDKWPRIVHQMKMRIGINTGEIVVGNMGSSIRKNYTMMGDAVNLAARLEAAGKQYGVYTLISEYTLNSEFVDQGGAKTKVADKVEVRFIDNITVVGKSEPVRIYELCAMKGELSEPEKELFAAFNNGMEHYLRMEWDAASNYFGEALKFERVPDGKTTPSKVFLERCRLFKKQPPVAAGKKWDGVFTLTEK